MSERQSVESRNDFVYKDEDHAQRITGNFYLPENNRANKFMRTPSKIERAKQENNELIPIFVKRIETAQ